ncbi:hypothetical protein H2202_009879 [Exophiala xenobiotica]|nr:hypothetical protein H2202_009879 [Exophiala xenobiotica]KAK5199496.1 hypothetical protein LTR92_000035 [Exophiala xenobiotica]KAK5210664.1 hypothetical protein LTR41_003274 [Exophiala xenobiotica]KAK5225007.1 hypothetical protein LTR72_004790 [Exophiala xenobiotica]KAK5237119.1 hypothetical protein LTR47_001383 [Exophiala xenobiotica]
MAISETVGVPAPHTWEPNAYEPATFEPQIHLSYRPPEEIITFDDLGLNPPTATSPVAITTPFPLLSAEGVRELRADIFRREVVGKYGSLKYPGVYRIRGYGPDAPFTYALWRSEAVRQACSEAAGTELDIIYDYEIGQLNVQLPADVDKDAPITENLPSPVPPRNISAPLEEDGALATETESSKALVSAWHNDSYPWVCVLMLSDPVGMKGGETALRTGDGSIMKVKPPGMGYAVMMQGGSINHAALPCLGEGERITFVTSFRSKDAAVRDSSSLRTVRPISNLDELYRQWASYRLDVVSQRAALKRKELDVRGRSADEIRQMMIEWVRDQVEYLENTVKEMA